MLSVDEVIAHAREVAEIQRKDNDNCKYKSQYGCKDCVDYYSKPCIECAEEHEQLAEWLEELKALRNGLNIKCDSLNEALEKGKKIGYNKAIDDFATDIINKINFEDKWLFNCKSNNADTDIAFSALRTFVNELAERLKAGGDDENTNQKESR